MTEADLVGLIEQDRVDLEADSVREPGDYADLVSGQGKLLKWDTINNAYLSAVAELQGVQISLGVNREPPFRGKSLKNVMEIRRTQADQLAREQFEDRGAGGVNSSYTDAEFLRMQLALLKSSVAKPTGSIAQALRIRVDLLLGHFLVLRGETRRDAELADLAVRELPMQEGATPCWLMMLLISNSKTNKWGKRQ